MKLYRVRNKQTGKFFQNWIAPWSDRWRGHVSWSDTGAFFKKIDTCVSHIEALCSDWVFEENKIYRFNRRQPVRWYPERLEIYEIVVTEVSVLGESAIPASDVVKLPVSEIAA